MDARLIHWPDNKYWTTVLKINLQPKNITQLIKEPPNEIQLLLLIKNMPVLLIIITSPH